MAKGVLQVDRNCWRILDVERSGLLVDARDYYRALHHAARQARRYILLAGWKFNGNVALLRGRDLPERSGEVELVPFLNELCEKNPDLKVYILAWDASVIYLFDRDSVHDWTAGPRLEVKLDSTHAMGASHHQKIAVIDGAVAFVGGIDICHGRWDERDHRPVHPDRAGEDGSPSGPFHDVQTCLVGPAAAAVEEHFRERWRLASGQSLDLPAPRIPWDPPVDFTLPVREGGKVALSRTHSATLEGTHTSVREIRQLYVDAILGARKIVYIENQFFTSRAIYQAFEQRLAGKRRPRLRIVLVLPKRPETLAEELALGAGQAKLVRALRELAEQNGHSIGIYWTGGSTRDGTEAATYIHAKLMIVDDRFLTVGSANASNRSLSLDTELNVTWEAASWRERDLIRAIRQTRTSLLLEHTGLEGRKARREFSRVRKLVPLLEEIAALRGSRLHRLEPVTLLDEDPFAWGDQGKVNPFDPEHTFIEDDLADVVFSRPGNLLARAIGFLRGSFSGLCGKKVPTDPGGP